MHISLSQPMLITSHFIL